jgi:hypothetical protein
MSVIVADMGLSGGIAAYTGPDAPPPAPVDPTTEFVAGGLRPELSMYVAPAAVPQFDVLYAQYGDLLIDWIFLDPMASSSINTIKEGVLADGIHCVPAVAPEADDEPTEAETLAEDEAEDADAVLAKEIAEFCNRAIVRLQHPTMDAACHELLDATAYMSEAAEIVWEMVDDGPDAGRASLKSLKPKPRSSWAFVLDWYGNVPGLYCAIPGKEARILPREKFALLAWMPRRGSPTGTSLFRPAYNAWNVKLQVWPEYFEFMKKMAAASLVVTTPENAQPKVPRDSDGNPIAGAKPVSPQKSATDTVAQLFGNCSVVALPFGHVVTPLEVSGDGTAFAKAFTECNREIVAAILQATRVTMEAEHGSKADSQTAQDVLGLVVRMSKAFVASVLRNDVFRPLVAANWGPQVAARLTPKVLLGDTDHQDFAAYANAIAALMQAGYFSPEQLPEIDQWLGVPVRRSIKRPDQAGQPANGQPQAPQSAPGSAPPPA